MNSDRMPWRWIVDDRPRRGAANMAVDQALLEEVQAGAAPCLRLYRWARPCLSLGRNQPGRGLDVAPAAAARGADVVRRPTGGGAVYHDRELTYAVVVPVGALGSPRETYRAINVALVEGLRRLGVAAHVVAAGGAGASFAGPCFAAALPGEVAVGGRKLVGSAQRRERNGLLQHGSLLLEGDQREAAELLGAAAAGGAGANGVVSLEGALGAVPAWDALVEAVGAGFEAALGVRLERTSLAGSVAARAAALEARFRSADWTWRR